MYLLYLDDSGSAANKNEEHFILGGFIAHEKSLYWINRRLDELANNYSTEQHVEFHASEIVRGATSPWNKIEKKERWDTLKEVLRVAHDTRNEITALACAIKKSDFPGEDPVESAFEDLCSRFQQFLNRKHQNNNESARGLIILDETSYETTLQKHAKNFRTLGNKWGYTTKDIQEVPLFVDSKASRCIQLADHIAYAVFRRYEKGDLNYYNVIESVLDKDENGKIHGLCHKTHNNNCTCPYCVQRRYGFTFM